MFIRVAVGRTYVVVDNGRLDIPPDSLLAYLPTCCWCVALLSDTLACIRVRYLPLCAHMYVLKGEYLSM